MRKADNLPPSFAIVTKSGKFNFLEPSRPVQACNGTALPAYHSNSRVYANATLNEKEMRRVKLTMQSLYSSCISGTWQYEA